MLARGARPARAIVAGQGLDVVAGATSRTNLYRRVLTAINGETVDEELARWIPHDGP
jgi:hypothetical protein